MNLKEYEDDLPVEYHPTFDVIDSSKLQCFTDCPRKFFYRYILGWQKEESNVHLVFGSAWHEAMEHLYNNGLDRDSVAGSIDKFLNIYRDAFPNEDTDEARRPKDVATAVKGLAQYAQAYRGMDDYEVLFTEVAATVPVREDRVIHTKTDAILREDGSIWSHEHKTTGRNSAPWREKWNIKIQVGTYSHLLFSLFPDEHVEGVKINGAIFTKSRGAEFLRIPVRKNSVDMQQFLWEVNHWWDILDWNFLQLLECSPEDDVMTCFPKNAESCSKFGCSYPGLCSVWHNPLKHMHRRPPDLKKEFWDPRRLDDEAKNVAKPDSEGNMTIQTKEEQDGDS